MGCPYIDPSYLNLAAAAAVSKAKQIFGTDAFDVSTNFLRSQLTADVSADTGNPQTYQHFAESSDFELLNQDFQLVRNRSSEQGVLHSIVAVGLEVNADHGYAATVTTDIENQRIWSVVGDGVTNIVIGQTVIASLSNGAIGYGKARQEVREGVVDILGGVQQASMHPLAGLVHVGPGETIKVDTMIDGGRWGTITMAEDFGLTFHAVDIVCSL